MVRFIYPKIRGLGHGSRKRLRCVSNYRCYRGAGCLLERQAGRGPAAGRDGPHASGTACLIIDNEPFLNTLDPVPRTNPGILAVAVSESNPSLGMDKVRGIV
jgi:hypothetical protein